MPSCLRRAVLGRALLEQQLTERTGHGGRHIGVEFYSARPDDLSATSKARQLDRGGEKSSHEPRRLRELLARIFGQSTPERMLALLDDRDNDRRVRQTVERSRLADQRGDGVRTLSAVEGRLAFDVVRAEGDGSVDARYAGGALRRGGGAQGSEVAVRQLTAASSTQPTGGLHSCSKAGRLLEAFKADDFMTVPRVRQTGGSRRCESVHQCDADEKSRERCNGDTRRPVSDGYRWQGLNDGRGGQVMASSWSSGTAESLVA